MLQISAGKLIFYTNSLIIMIHRQCKTVTEIQSSELKTIMVDIDCGP